jgi:hypothetical protein
MIIDKSGSMGCIKVDAMSGFNGFLRDQQKLGDSAKVTLRVFNSFVEDIYSGNIMECPPLDEKNYRPSGGTALLDALGDTLEKMLRGYDKLDPKPHMVIVLLTDGEEANSRKWTWATTKHMVDKCRSMGWEFIFLGASELFQETAIQLGIDEKKAINFRTDKEGVRKAFAQVSSSVSRLRLEMRQ